MVDFPVVVREGLSCQPLRVVTVSRIVICPSIAITKPISPRNFAVSFLAPVPDDLKVLSVENLSVLDFIG